MSFNPDPSKCGKRIMIPPERVLSVSSVTVHENLRMIFDDKLIY